MNELQQQTKVFIESECAKLNCAGIATPLTEGYAAICESENTPLTEGKVGKAMGTLGIAIGSLLGHANAGVNNLDLRSASVSDINEIKTTMEQDSDIEFCKLKPRGLVCKDTNNTVTVFPTDNLPGFSDDITEIVFLDGYKNPDKESGVVLNFKNGSKQTITHKTDERYGYITTFDEFDVEKHKELVSPSQVSKTLNFLYEKALKNVDIKPEEPRSAFEQHIIQKYSNSNRNSEPEPQHKTTTLEQSKPNYQDDSLTTAQNRQINDIMAKYKK
jgi:hypothetical protein